MTAGTFHPAAPRIAASATELIPSDASAAIESPDWLRRGRIPSLDGLRAVAVALVLCAHARHTAGRFDVGPLHWVGLVGSVGVDIFFVLSGFLITTLLLRESERTGRINLRAFYLRRVLRIVPAYASLLLVVFFLQTLNLASPSRGDWVTALTYTVNFRAHPVWELGHAWSLSIEEHFYLVWPFLLWVLPSNRRWHFAAGTIALSLVARLAITAVAPQWMSPADNWTFTRLDGIAAGCLLALIAWNPVQRTALHRLLYSRWVVLCVFLVFVLSLAAGQRSAKYSFGLMYSVNAVCIALLVWAAATSRTSRVARFLNWSPIAAIGVGSYSLYLWQQLFLNPRHHYWWTSFPQNLGFAALAAAASYFLIESPFLRVKDRIGKTRRATRPIPNLALEV